MLYELITHHVRRQSARLRQSEHGQRAVGLDFDQPLGQSAGAHRSEPEVENEDMAEAVAVLPEIGGGAGQAAVDAGEAEAGRIEGGERPVLGSYNFV